MSAKRFPGLLLVVFLALSLGLTVSIGPVRAADPALTDTPVTFALSSAKARQGETAVLVFSLRTEVALRSISVAMDFEESKVRVLDVRRIQRNVDGATPQPPDDVASTSVSNANQSAGDQIREGWVHLELNIQGDKAQLPLEEGKDLPVLEIEFLVLPDAPLGFSPVTFETVGPVDFLPSTFFINWYEIAGLADVAKDMAPAALKSGGIDIIGEVGFFMRGDANFDKTRNITDVIASLSYLFLGGQSIPCLESADSNDDGQVNISDAIFSLWREFDEGGSFPDPDVWGLDPTPDALGCAVYPGS